YAIKGVMYTNQIEKLHSENMKLRAELQDTKKNYENLKEGIYNILKGDSKTRIANIAKLEQQGKNFLDKKVKKIEPPSLEELGL
ncbi:hypothetical protein QTH94_14820, partial [Clostridium perfringens]|nr:hypothetical protein [Clostridium perfringens]